MIYTIDGVAFRNMVDYAVRNLNLHCKIVNQLNVFPVPDGDTGTNMVTTIHKSLLALGDSLQDLPSISQKFANSVVFEARGNSGVIVSQFFKGVAEAFQHTDEIDSQLLIQGLEQGVGCAYAAVATPVEGTMLTVLKDATNAVKRLCDANNSVNEVIACFLDHARISLDHTPELLPVLKESGVVDSGGAGIVYLFEGMKKFLDGEDLESSVPLSTDTAIDYDAFHRQSQFPYGYCTELLIQLLDCKSPFSHEKFTQELSAIGDSLVTSVNNDKVRVHVHTRFPEQVFTICHQYGEFLSLKVENMTVQHSDLTQNIQCSDQKSNSIFSVVAVCNDPQMMKLFLEMGADVVIYNPENVSTKEYLDAFNKARKEQIVVFPNSSDAILSAIQAKKMYSNGCIRVINSRSVAECYAALPAIDFEETDMDAVVDNIQHIINHLYIVSIAKRNNPIVYKNESIYRDEYYSFSGKELITVGKDLRQTATQTILKILKENDYEILTVFHKESVPVSLIEAVVQDITDQGICAEVFTVATDSLRSDLAISFE